MDGMKRVSRSALAVLACDRLGCRRSRLHSRTCSTSGRRGSSRCRRTAGLVAFTVRTTEWSDNRYDSEIWLCPRRGGAHPADPDRQGRQPAPRAGRRMGRGSASSPTAARSSRSTSSPAAGGEALKATAAKDGVTDFRWSPDGKWIAYTAAEPESEAMKQRKEKYGEFSIEDADYAMTHLWVVPVAARHQWAAARCPRPTRLTEGTGTRSAASPGRPDSAGDRLRPRRHAADQRQAEPGHLGGDGRHEGDPPAGGGAGQDTGPVWSPDGRWIAYCVGRGRHDRPTTT